MKKAEAGDNVMKGEGTSTIPKIYQGGFTQETTPNIVSKEKSMAAGKAKMNFDYPPLSPDQTLVGGEGIKHRSANPPINDGTGVAT